MNGLSEYCMAMGHFFMGALRGVTAFVVVGLMIWFGAWLMDKLGV